MFPVWWDCRGVGQSCIVKIARIFDQGIAYAARRNHVYVVMRSSPRKRQMWFTCWHWPTVSCTTSIIHLPIRSSRPSFRRIGCPSTRTIPSIFLRSSQAEVPSMPVGSLSQARRARSRFAPCTPADHWDLVGDGAEDVEYQVIDDEDCPGANHD